jgi:hypothetical protein
MRFRTNPAPATAPNLEAELDVVRLLGFGEERVYERREVLDSDRDWPIVNRLRDVGGRAKIVLDEGEGGDLQRAVMAKLSWTTSVRQISDRKQRKT